MSHAPIPLLPMPRSLSRSQSRDRSRSRSPERRRDLPSGAEPISESDYFLKNAEFRAWLHEEKRKYFDELSGDKSRSYFRKFVKAWNRGKLSRRLYVGIEPEVQSNTAYKWSFVEKTSKADRDALAAARSDIRSSTNDLPAGSSSASVSAATSRRAVGPTLPSASDLTLARELVVDQAVTDRKSDRKRQRAEEKERVEEMVGPKPLGREGQLEAKRAKRENDKEFRDAKDDGFSAVDEKTLMGESNSFQAALARRDAGKKRGNSRREERDAELRERASAMREKEKNTMDVFMKMAAERFG